MNIAEILQKQSLQRPEQVAIIDGVLGHERKTSFKQLNTQSAQFSAQLKSYGLEQGDTVLIFQPISVELYVILIGLFRLGLIAMFVDPSTGLDHLERCCQRVRPKVLIGSTKAHLLRFVSKSLRVIPIKITSGLWLPFTKSYAGLKHYKASDEIVDADAELPALITFTSGSTGLPKAAVRTHGFLLAQHSVLADNIAHKAGQVDASTLPIFVLANLASGMTSLLCDIDFRFPAKVNAEIILKQARSFAATRCAASPAFFEQIIRYCAAKNISRIDFDRIDTGGAPVFPGLLSQLQQLSPQAEIVAVYGSTEAEPIAHIHWQDISDEDYLAMQAGQGLLAGKPVAQIDVKVIKDQTGTAIKPLAGDEWLASPLKPGEVGEIVVAGEHVLPGYLHGKGDEETKFSVAGRPWHRTGDAGYFDAQGRLWLMGRCSAKMSDQSGELYPFAVETVIRCNPDVHRCAMLSFKSKRVLVLQAKENINLDKKAIKLALAWARVEKVLTVPYIPVDKRHNAKVDYPELNKLLESLL